MHTTKYFFLMAILLLLTSFGSVARAEGPLAEGTKEDGKTEDLVPPPATEDEKITLQYLETNAIPPQAAKDDEATDAACRRSTYLASVQPRSSEVVGPFTTTGCYYAINSTLTPTGYVRALVLRADGSTTHYNWTYIQANTPAKIIALYVPSGARFYLQVWNPSTRTATFTGVTTY